MKKMMLLFLMFPVFVFGQKWLKTYEDGIGYSVLQNDGGEYVIAGTEDINTRSDLFIMKTDIEGNILWKTTYGNSSYDIGYSVIQTSDGGYVVTGNAQLNLVTDRLCLLKFNSEGDTIWTKVFEYESIGRSVIETIDGGFIIAGDEEQNTIDKDILLLKTDGNGDVEWMKTFEVLSLNDEIGYSVLQTADTGYLLTGRILNDAFSLYLVKTDGNGDSIWTKSFSHEDYLIHDGYSLQQTSDGGFVIFSTIAPEFFGNDLDIYIIKIDAEGNEIWSKTLGNEYNYCYSGRQTIDGGFILTGNIYNSYTDNFDICLVKLNESGELIWTKKLTSSEYNDCGYSVIQTNDNGFLITGSIGYYYDLKKKICLIKTDSEGNITSTTEIPLPNTNRKLIKTINLQGKEIQPRENIPYIEVYDDGSTEKKIIIN